MREAKRRAALAAFRAAAADYQQTVLQAFGQVADILQALTHDTNLLSLEQRALDSTAETVTQQRIQHRMGSAGILELLDAQRQYRRTLLA
jgi:outer membrane protein TolC